MPDKKPDKKPKSSDDSAKLDAYIIQSISTDFPMIEEISVIDRAKDGDDLVGVIKDKNNRAYTFFIAKADPRPQLQRIGQAKP